MNQDDEQAAAGRTIHLRWGELGDLAPVPVDEAFFQDLGDRVFLTFGQLQLPLSLGVSVPESLEIRPAVRLIMTREAARKLHTLLSTGPFAKPQEDTK